MNPHWEELKKRYIADRIGDTIMLFVGYICILIALIRPEHISMQTAIIAIVLVTASWIFRERLPLKDLVNIKNQNYLTVTGTVMELKQKGIPGKNLRIYPVIRNDETGERIVLNISHAEAIVGNVYTVIYLPYTKLAVISEEHMIYSKKP